MNAIEILKGCEEFIKREFRVKKIGIFGSFALGKERIDSDIEDLFSRKVDLVTVAALRQPLREDILSEIIYA